MPRGPLSMTTYQTFNLVQKWAVIVIFGLVIGAILLYSMKGTDFNLGLKGVFNAFAGL